MTVVAVGLLPLRGMRKADHDVSGEARDDHGKWTSGDLAPDEAAHDMDYWTGKVAPGPDEKVWVITARSNFKLNPNRKATHNYISVNDVPDMKGIYVTNDPEYWWNGHDYKRPFMAQITVKGRVPWENVPQGHSQAFINGTEFDKLHVDRVIPADEYARETYHEPGWIETDVDHAENRRFAEARGRADDPDVKLVDIPSDYHYTGPDVRDMMPEQVKELKHRFTQYSRMNKAIDPLFGGLRKDDGGAGAGSDSSASSGSGPTQSAVHVDAIMGSGTKPKRRKKTLADYKDAKKKPGVPDYFSKGEGPGHPFRGNQYSSGQHDYQGLHRSPSPDDGDPLQALGSNLLPEDINDQAHQLQYYGTGDTASDRESFAVVNAMRGKPDAPVTIYRAVPPDVVSMHPGDWVTLSPHYAWSHVNGPLRGQGHVLKRQATAKDLWTNGDSINEWGWHPRRVEKAGHDVTNQLRGPDGRWATSVPATENMNEAELHAHLSRYHVDIPVTEQIPLREIGQAEGGKEFGGWEDTGRVHHDVAHEDDHTRVHAPGMADHIPHVHAEPTPMDEPYKNFLARHPELVDLALSTQPLDPAGDAIAEGLQAMGAPGVLAGPASSAIGFLQDLATDPHKYDHELHTLGRFLARMKGTKPVEALTGLLTQGPREVAQVAGHNTELHTLGAMLGGMDPFAGVHKGEGAGHAFRGNQYTTGTSGSESPSSSPPPSSSPSPTPSSPLTSAGNNVAVRWDTLHRMSPHVMGVIALRIRRLADQYPNVVTRGALRAIGAASLGKDVYASTIAPYSYDAKREGTIEINDDAWGNPHSLGQQFKDDAAGKHAGFHVPVPHGTSWLHDAETYTAYHEFAHALWLSLDPLRKNIVTNLAADLALGSDKPKYVAKHLSQYAATSPAEFVAEAWTEYKLMGDKARPWAKEVGGLLDRQYAVSGKDTPSVKIPFPHRPVVPSPPPVVPIAPMALPGQGSQSIWKEATA